MCAVGSLQERMATLKRAISTMPKYRERSVLCCNLLCVLVFALFLIGFVVRWPKRELAFLLVL